MKLSRNLKYTLSLLAALLLLYICFKDVEWRSFWGALRGCSWGWVVLSMLLGVVVFLLRALRWRELLLPIDPGTGRLTCYDATCLGYVANMLFPRAGELVRCGYITNRSTRDSEGHRLASFDKVLGTVIADRVWDIVFMVAICALVVGGLWERFGEFFSSLVGGGASQGRGLFLLLAAAGAVVLLAVLIIWRLRDSNPWCAKAWGAVLGIWEGLISSVRMKSWWKFLLYTFLIWVLYWLMSYCVVLALQGISPGGPVGDEALGLLSRLGAMDALFIMIAGTLSTVVPVPGGFGAYHYIIMMALSSIYGIPQEVGLLFATLAHESQAIAQLVCGGISHATETVRKN